MKFPIIDAHTHIFSDVTGLCEDRHMSNLVRMIDRYDIQAAVLIPLFGGMAPSPDEIEAGNRAAEEWGRRDTRFMPMVTVYPRQEKHSIEQLCRYMDRGFSGLKVWISIADEPCMDLLIEKMIEYGKPTLIHTMHKTVGQYPLESDPIHIANLAKRYPEAAIILPHVGGNFFYTCDVIQKHRNIIVDISGTHCESGMLEHTVRTLGADRVLFGSDAPVADFVNNYAKVAASELNDEDLYAIFFGNARKLWRLRQYSPTEQLTASANSYEKQCF